ncbi:Hypothetical predicted protein [Mytilus galloprovincialis]|uniref:Reverse transcriptase domain-containing protein n=1 Tax=Mytilus galloprovincialis TaxID=29158 RepID=A0A8B6D3B6_MYTGA|nr:Hypothetical predicted protein [Mytilus galloprovincialis]
MKKRPRIKMYSQGRTNKIKHSIDTGDARPVRVPPRRLPIGKREIERTEVSKMLERGIIEPSNSPWSAPLVLITKARSNYQSMCGLQIVKPAVQSIRTQLGE